MADPTIESFLIAGKVSNLRREIGKEEVWTILSKVQSGEMESVMMEELKNKKANTLGTVHYDSEVGKAGLMGTPLDRGEVAEDVR